ncbi:AAA family ATPase [Streptacidiphilus anmyonensis]|uniref:AAA family ATPase n=1 Tax=Streptacidiphilus anmyonensis TaxID=405782 RepID=UPI000A04B6D5|nr:ATP-binding protein [Streptacidiphilus anmyonensis]
MLLSVTISNFRSLQGDQTLDLRPVYQSEADAQSVAALYGANASGKSNVLRGIRFIHDAITGQADRDQAGNMYWAPFLLDHESRTKPSRFSVDLLIGGTPYSYGFSIDMDGIAEEWLFSFPKKKKRILFERSKDGYYFGPTFGSAKAGLLSEITGAKELFITNASRADAPDAKIITEWFRDSVWFADDDDKSRQSRRAMTRELLVDPETRNSIETLLKAADFGINRATVSNLKWQFEEVSDDSLAPGSFAVEERDGIARIKFNGKLASNLEQAVLENLHQRTTIRFQHLGDRARDFTIDDESRGTQTWFDIAGVVTQALSKGWTLVVDELDTSLHPLLLAQMIRLFQHSETNGHGAQLIFTTHDASLMGRPGGEELLKRDEIWFTEKNSETGATELFPLTDFRPRAGLNWEKRYLGGAVGAIPFIADNFDGVADDPASGSDVRTDVGA